MCSLTEEKAFADRHAAFWSNTATCQGPDTQGRFYWTLQFSLLLDSGTASGLGASRPRLALRPSLGLSAGLLSGRLLTERDLVVGSRNEALESTGLC